MNVLLDLDGTLTDPREGIVACFRHALTALGSAGPSDADLERWIGPPLRDGFRALLGSTDAALIDAAVAAYRERFASRGLFENRLYPEIPSALAALRARGGTLYVATSKPRVYAERIVRHFGLEAAVRAVHGSELDGARSDKAELIGHILHVESLPAASTCMVGDRAHDVVGARAHGVRSVGALWGFGSREELVAAGVTVVCERPAILPDVVASLGATPSRVHASLACEL